MSANSIIVPTAQGLVLENIKKFAKILGSRGTVAGGAVRDLHFGLIPKDYDLFVYTKEDWDRLEEELYDTEGIEYLRGGGHNEYYNTMSSGDISVSTWNWKDGDVEIQLIHYDCVPTSPRSVISGFDFTINMMAYAEGYGFVITEEAKRSMALEEMELNPKHRQRVVESKPENFRFIADTLLSRGHRIARKLRFSFPKRTIDAILAKYPYVNTELLDMDL